MNKVMARLETLEKLQAKDREIKAMQKQLDEEINAFFAKEVGVDGPATLVDIAKRLLETSHEPKIIT